MPHRDQTKHALRRAAFTGEDLRVATARLRRLQPGEARIPVAGPEQALLEADIFSWLARPREYAYYPFHIRALAPHRDRLDLYVDESPASTADLLRSVLPTMLNQQWSMGVLGLRITAWRPKGIDLQRPDSPAVIRLHGAPQSAWRRATAEIAEGAAAVRTVDVPWHSSPDSWTEMEMRENRLSASLYDPSSTWFTSGLLRRIRIFKSVVPTYCADGWPARDTHQFWKFDIAYYGDLDPRIEHLRQALTDPDYGLPLRGHIRRTPAQLELRATNGGPESLLLHFSKCSPGRYWAEDRRRAKEVRFHAEHVASQSAIFPGPASAIRR